jgi:ABC-type amino acid transport system permease subunit
MTRMTTTPSIEARLRRMSSSPVLAGLAWTYIWIFRSVPLLVQLLLWYNIGYLYETIVLGIPHEPGDAGDGRQ